MNCPCFLKPSKREDGGCKDSWIGFKLDLLVWLLDVEGSFVWPQEGTWEWALWVDCDLSLGRGWSMGTGQIMVDTVPVIVAAIRMVGDATVYPVY